MRRMLGALNRDAADPDLVASALANDGRGFVDRLPEHDELPAWLHEEELAVYVEEFTRTGFTGGINWYRNLDRNWELTPQLDGAKITVPSLFVGGANDPVLTMTPPSVMDGWLDDHRGTVVVDGAGHWVQQEKPAEVNAALIDFIASVREGRS
jgi:pimeloyl-ACP methyl ester carboxylesterase